MLTSRFRSTPIAAAAFSVLFVGLLLHGCSDLPCTNNGMSYLVVPESRVAFLDSIEANGICDVYAPAEDCDAGQCPTAGDAGLSLLFPVVGRAQGRCTVTATFTDGMEPLISSYKFGGPLDNCCTEICARN